MCVSMQLLEPSPSEVLGKTPHVEQATAANRTAAEGNTQEVSLHTHAARDQ